VYRLAVAAIQQIADCGCARAARWLDMHLTGRILLDGAIIAWLDAISTAVEGMLLLTGRSWARWTVVAGSMLLVPLEVWSVWRHPRPARIFILVVNCLIVVYLVRSRQRYVPE
jgi:uncharacterized membrane protein (DUF2068 family)